MALIIEVTLKPFALSYGLSILMYAVLLFVEGRDMGFKGVMMWVFFLCGCVLAGIGGEVYGDDADLR